MGILDKFRLDGKSAIVTGASSGLGIAFAEALAEAGADVVISARRGDLLAENAKRISAATGRMVVPFKADMSSESEIEALVKKASEKFGKIDIVINNAGTAVGGPSGSIKKEDWEKVVAVNLTGVFLCSKAAIQDMVDKKVSGSIINVASIYGFVGDRFPAVPYFATKGGVVNLTRALAVEFAPNGIRVNAIAPGFFPSEMTDRMLKSERARSHIISRTPMGRLGDPSELKGAAVYLASDASSYVTGHILAVDGGWLAE